MPLELLLSVIYLKEGKDTKQEFLPIYRNIIVSVNESFIYRKVRRKYMLSWWRQNMILINCKYNPFFVTFFISWDGVRLSPLFTSATNSPIVPAPDDRWVWSSSWNENWQGKPKYWEKTCPSATLFTTNPTWPDLESNPGRRRLIGSAISRSSLWLKRHWSARNPASTRSTPPIKLLLSSSALWRGSKHH
jgi:hypothetical protein